MNKNKVHVKIGGASYTIVTEDEPEYVETLADEISENMRAIINANPSLSTLQRLAEGMNMNLEITFIPK